VAANCGAFFPFGDGPRRCIGEHFARAEAAIVMATLARAWSLDRVSHELDNARGARGARGEKRHESYELLRDLRHQLQAGAVFEPLAKAHSDKGDEHVDLGFFKRGELAEEFEVVAFSLDVGEISPVFATPFGYHLITVTERKPATPKPFEDVRPQVLELVLAERRQEKTRKLVEELQARATIEEVEEESVHA